MCCSTRRPSRAELRSVQGAGQRGPGLVAARDYLGLAWRAGGISLRRVKEPESDLAGHPDRRRWNERYGAGFIPSFTPHPLAVAALALDLPAGPVADLASGPSGSALLAAAQGRPVTAVDVSEVALGLLGQEARRRGLDHLITLVHADLGAWRPGPGRYALVLATGFWDPGVFAAAVPAVAPGRRARLGGVHHGRPPGPAHAARRVVPGPRGASHAAAGRHVRGQPGRRSGCSAEYPAALAGPPDRARRRS